MIETIKRELRKISPLTDEDCALFENQMKVRSVEKNELWVREGQICKEMAFIYSGAFRMYYLHNDKEVNTYFFFENQFLSSFQSFLLHQPSRYYIQALEPSELVIFQNSDIERAYASSHNWEKFGRIIAENCYIEATLRTESFLFLTGEQRYLQLLEKHPQIFERVPLYHIASYLGIERESLSRLRRKIINA